MSFVEYVFGRIADRGADWVVVDLHGMGLRIGVPMSTAEALTPGEDAKLWCHLYIREDVRALYGFGTTAERGVFLQLLGVGGVGPRTALSALSMLGAERLAAAIEGGDEAALSRIPGVGKRTATRIATELKGKMPALGDGVAAAAGTGSLLDALMTFGGLSRSEASAALASVPPDPDRTEDETLRLAFRAHGTRSAERT
ncbi:MAG: Holliday junction branch migration protein RuvA [Dehalococcoidia bacterium]